MEVLLPLQKLFSVLHQYVRIFVHIFKTVRIYSDIHSHLYLTPNIFIYLFTLFLLTEFIWVFKCLLGCEYIQIFIHFFRRLWILEKRWIYFKWAILIYDMTHDTLAYFWHKRIIKGTHQVKNYLLTLATIFSNPHIHLKAMPWIHFNIFCFIYVV